MIHCSRRPLRPRLAAAKWQAGAVACAALAACAGGGDLAGPGGSANPRASTAANANANTAVSTVEPAGSAPARPASPPGGQGSGAVPAGPYFEEAAKVLGVDFVHDAGLTGDFYFPEINGSGVAAFDYDGDGDIDLYFCQGGALADAGDPAVAAASDTPPGRLYRNRLTEAGVLGFEDVTAAAGLDQRRGYGVGAAAGDIDNDGDVDLYLSNFGHDQLWRNDGDGTFTDVTDAAGVDDPRWTSSAAFVDYDRDGWLDLAVVNYVDFAVATHKPCFGPSGARDYCSPQSYKPVPGRLFRNRGDGTFEDRSGPTGFAAEYGAGLGVVAADFDADGWPDLLVANDGMDNQLWMNRGGTRFENTARLAGVAYNADGETEANMGVVVEDVDGDEDDDVFISHLTGEHNSLWVNDGHAVFSEVSERAGLAAASFPETGFGVGSLDVDGDGWIDFVVVNGAVNVAGMNAGAAPATADDPLAPYRQRHQIFRNRGDGTFDDVSAAGGPAFAKPDVGRGLAVADLDDDGAADVVVSNADGPARVLINRLGPPPAWIGLRLVEGPAGRQRDAYGAVATLRLADGRALRRRAHADGSYLSARDPRVIFGLGAGGAVVGIDIRWPDGTGETRGGGDLPLNRYVTLARPAEPGATP